MFLLCNTLVYFCQQTFVNSTALLVFLMALQLIHVDRKSFRSCFYSFFSLWRDIEAGGLFLFQLISRIFDSSYVLGCGRDFKLAD